MKWIFQLIIFLSLYNYFQTRIFKLEKLELNLGKAPLKAIFISDFHNNKINLSRLSKTIQKQNPDAIFLGGDIISRNTKNFQRVEKFLATFSDYKTFFVLGNHEEENPKIDDFLKILSKYNIINLSDGGIYRERGISISGTGISTKNTPENYASKDKNELKICLGHSIEEIFKTRGYDLALCGHTHGGQIRLPILGQVLDHGFKLFPKYSKGLYKKDGSYIYISSGLGNSSLAIRTFNRISISFISIS